MKDNILENEINITEIIKEVEIQKKENIIDKINNYLDINNFEYAKRLAEELIKKEPKYKEAYLVLSDIYYEEENYKAVIDISFSKILSFIYYLHFLHTNNVIHQNECAESINIGSSAYACLV